MKYEEGRQGNKTWILENGEMKRDKIYYKQLLIE